VFHEFKTIVNLVFKKLIAWPMETKTNSVVKNFKQWCGLPNMHKAINGIHIIILKPFFFSSRIIIIIQRTNIPLLFESLLIVRKHLLMFVLDCQIMSMNLKFYIGLFCVVVVNIKICLILTKVWKVFHLYSLGDEGYGH